MRRALILVTSTGAALLLAPPALAGSLPAPGTWIYDGSSKKVPIFKVFVSVNPVTGSSIYAVNGVVDGKCKYKGKKVFGSADFNVDTNKGIKIAIKPNGTFKSKWFKTIGDAAGERGKAQIKGTFKGTKVSGTVTARTKGNALGPFSGKGKFRGTGEQIA